MGINYQNAKVYKIVCNDTGLTYYGSTCSPQLCDRIAQHRSGYKRYLEGKIRYITSFSILQGGNYYYALVELFPCNSKDELGARERYYIENFDCVNKYIPGRTSKEWDEANKEHLKELRKAYYEANKEHLIAKSKAYHEANQEELKEKKKEYYEANKERISKKYREKNKEQINQSRKQIVKCPCGCEVTKGSLFKHQQSKNHQARMEAIQKITTFIKNKKYSLTIKI